MDFFKKEKELDPDPVNPAENPVNLNPVPIFDREKTEEIPKQAVFMGAVLELLRDLRDKVNRLYFRLAELEKKFEERVPERTLGESTFKKEVVDGEEIVQKVISEVKSMARPVIASKKQLSIVEQRKIEKIMSILQEHGKLSSSQLASIMNLSRTRCNEYFKQMEELNLVESVPIGKEKYYRIKD